MERGRKQLKRSQDALREEEKGLENARREVEDALARTRGGRDEVERERGDMLRGFQDIRVALEVRV